MEIFFKSLGETYALLICARLALMFMSFMSNVFYSMKLSVISAVTSA